MISQTPTNASLDHPGRVKIMSWIRSLEHNRQLFLCIAMGIALVLRGIYLLQNRSFWWDESAYLIASRNSWSDIILGEYYFFPTHPWGYIILLKILSFTSLSEWWLRLSSTLPSGFTVYFVYGISKLILKREKASLIAALAFALSAYHLYHSVFIKETELALCFNLGALYAFLQLGSKNTVKWQIVFDIFLLLSILTSYYSIWLILLLGMLFFSIWFRNKAHRTKLGIFILHTSAVVLICLWWLIKLIHFRKDISILIGWIPQTHWFGMFDLWGKFFNTSSILATSIILMSLLVFLYDKKKDTLAKIVLLYWLLALPMIAVLLSILYIPFFVDWYMAFLSIPIYILVGNLLDSYLPKFIVAMMLVLLVVQNIMAIKHIIQSPTEDWRGPYEHFASLSSNDAIDTVYLSDDQHFEYYSLRNQNLQNFSYKQMPKIHGSEYDMEKFWDEVAKDIQMARRVCVVAGAIPSGTAPLEYKDLFKKVLGFSNPPIYCTV